MPARVQKKDLAPGPGHYGQAPGDEGSYNPWFKRSYNMRYAENWKTFLNIFFVKIKKLFFIYKFKVFILIKITNK